MMQFCALLLPMPARHSSDGGNVSRLSASCSTSLGLPPFLLTFPSPETSLITRLPKGSSSHAAKKIEALIHFLSGAMALQLCSDHPFDAPRADPAPVASSFTAFTLFLVVPPDRLLANVPPGRYASTLRRALYCTLGDALRRDCPWLLDQLTHCSASPA